MPYAIYQNGRLVAQGLPDKSSAELQCARYFPGGVVVTHREARGGR
jgi:hypothetical protein